MQWRKWKFWYVIYSHYDHWVFSSKDVAKEVCGRIDLSSLPYFLSFDLSSVFSIDNFIFCYISWPWDWFCLFNLFDYDVYLNYDVFLVYFIYSIIIFFFYWAIDYFRSYWFLENIKKKKLTNFFFSCLVLLRNLWKKIKHN